MFSCLCFPVQLVTDRQCIMETQKVYERSDMAQREVSSWAVRSIQVLCRKDRALKCVRHKSSNFSIQSNPTQKERRAEETKSDAMRSMKRTWPDFQPKTWHLCDVRPAKLELKYCMDATALIKNRMNYHLTMWDTTLTLPWH